MYHFIPFSLGFSLNDGRILMKKWNFFFLMLPNSWITPNKEIWWEIISCSCFWVQSFFLQSSTSCKASVLDIYTSAAAIFNSLTTIAWDRHRNALRSFHSLSQKTEDILTFGCLDLVFHLHKFSPLFVFFSVPLWCNFLQKTMALKVVETIATAH